MKAKISIVECPECHYRFNHQHVQGALNYSMTLGTKKQLFRCPHCNNLRKFNVTQDAADPSLPTYAVPPERLPGGSKWWQFIGAVGLLACIGVIIAILLHGL